MLGKSPLFALAFAGCLAAPVPSFAQGAGDAGVSGIPRGPGSAGGLNNSVNDPSGIGNAARIPPPPPPSIAVPVVPSAPTVSGRLSPRSAPIVTKVNRRVLAPRISSLVFPCRDRRPGQVDRSKDEHPPGL